MQTMVPVLVPAISAGVQLVQQRALQIVIERLLSLSSSKRLRRGGQDAWRFGEGD